MAKDMRPQEMRPQEMRPQEMRPHEMGMSKEMRMSNHHGGHLYMQTNELRNCLVHYHRSANGKLHEVERVLTGGAGSGGFKPISGQESQPDDFEGAGSVILTPDRRFLFTTHGGRKLVSSFPVGEDCRLYQGGAKPTGNAGPAGGNRPGRA